MYKIRKIFLFTLLLLYAWQDVSAGDSIQDKNILILHAMAPSTPAYRSISDGIRTRLNEEFGDNYNLHLEYLESERYPRGAYPKDRFDLYNEKYKDVNLDLLICIGVNIVDPVKKNASEKILNLPAVVIDFDLSDLGLLPSMPINRTTAVLPMKLDVIGTVNSATALFPERNTIYFISGTSNTDRIYLEATIAVEDKLAERFSIHYLTNISMDQVLSKVRHLPASSLVIIPSFYVDSKGVPYYNPESIRLISEVASVPVFAYTDMGFGDGSMGGQILSFRKTGLIAGETAVKILNGVDPASIIIKSEELFDLVFDWRQLERWDRAGSDLIPGGSRILFKEISFFEKYRGIIFMVLLFILLQTMLILNLVRLNRKHRYIAKQLIESENKYRELVREDRILSLGQLTASLSHELNQPLTAILSTAQAGVRFIDSKNHDPELLKELFSNIVEDDKRTAAILSSIRGMLRLEKRDKERVDLNALVDEIIRIYHGEFVRINIRLEMQLSEQKVYIHADQIQIKQVIMNLILNAMQAVRSASLNNRRIIISQAIEKNHVTLTVRDFGKGIAEDMIEKLFKPFVTSKKEGTGIGLAISKSIIEEHQGRIWAENHPEGGADFAFSLKIFDDE